MKLVLPAIVVLLAIPACATPITYSLNEVGPTASAVGTVTTDGTLGALSPANIDGFDFTVYVAGRTVTYGKGQTSYIPPQTEAFSRGGSSFFNISLKATSSGLFYDFGNTTDSWVTFEDAADLNDMVNGVCFSGGYCSGALPGFQGVTVFVNRDAFQVLSFSGTEEIATVVAGPAAMTPEPSSFALLGTGLLGVAGVIKLRLA